jgi:hypothetical protein
MQNLIGIFAFLCAAALLYRFRAPLLGRLRRFDAANAALAEAQRRDRHDRFAHYRHAVMQALEESEPVAEVEVRDERTGEKVKRYRFLAEDYATREDADRARMSLALDKARAFYAEIDQQFLGKYTRGR